MRAVTVRPDGPVRPCHFDASDDAGDDWRLIRMRDPLLVEC